nr:hypothetical protein [Verrucomicrobiota bacterium]
MKWNSRIRCALVCIAFIALFSVFSFRLIHLQIAQHEEYAEVAAEKHGDKQIIFAERGPILDAKGEILAHNVPNETVVLDATLVRDPDALVPILAKELDLDAAEIRARLETKKAYIVLKREVPLETTAALRKELEAIKQRRCVNFERTFTRFYPNGNMLCHVLGFTDFNRKGIQGVEATMERYLHGEDGYRLIEHNRAGQELVSY